MHIIFQLVMIKNNLFVPCGFFHFSMHIIFQLVMIKNNLFVPCALVSFVRLHRLETHDYRWVKVHDILGYFCILKGGEP
jgi:hypothetical protein